LALAVASRQSSVAGEQSQLGRPNNGTALDDMEGIGKAVEHLSNPPTQFGQTSGILPPYVPKSHYELNLRFQFGQRSHRDVNELTEFPRMIPAMTFRNV
jgi:hypothetical protein